MDLGVFFIFIYGYVRIFYDICKIFTKPSIFLFSLEILLV